MSKTDSDVEDLPLDSSRAPTATTTTDGGGTTTRTETDGERTDEEEEEEAEEEEPEVYNSEDFISGPSWPITSTIPKDILVFNYSFGYDCKRYDNLVVADENTLAFASGNFINFLDIKTRKMKFRKSAFGWGIGHIQTYPNTEHNHLVVAEQGRNPPIIIYEWPSLEIFGLLKGGSTKRYTHMDYSPDGSLLVSQAGEPDYLITIWNWPVRKILLRTKSYVNDVFIVKFSPFCEGQLASCGVSHIKFWKMATTFTGLKLKGELGRFGKTEYSDIVGVLPLPDEKVLSGCQWGNVLVWDEGLIKYEICRRQRKKCHDGPIMYLAYNNGELWTAALDGRIRIWYFDSIDRADPPDDDRVVQAEPVYEFEFPGISFMTLKKQMKNDPNNTIYFVQDGNGGIWRVDLTTEKDAEPPTQLYKCHAGAVADIASSPFGSYLATLGTDGYFFIYDYIRRTMLFHHQFPAKGVCIIWLPLSVEPSGDEIIMAFDDGNLRSVIISITEDGSASHFNYYQLIKPHSKPITTMKLNSRGNILVTGSEDKTIFVFETYQDQGQYTKLIPIGLVHVPDVVTCLYWQNDLTSTVMVGCLHGQYVIIHVPKTPQDYTTVSYELKVDVMTRCFKTYKAQIRRNIKIKEIEAKKAKKVERKREEMERVKKENPGLEIDEEVFLADSESEEELEPLHIPHPPNKILWMQITPDDTIWLSMAGYDAGYIYEYEMDQTTDVPYRFKMVDDADDIEISSYVYNYNNKYLIFAMQDGTIRVNRVNPDDHRDLSDYWKLPMHDNFKGYIPKMCFSFDEQYFFTCGEDGNVFSCTFHPEHNDYNKQRHLRVKTGLKALALIEDIGGYKTLSLEQMKVKAEEDRIEDLANKHKQEVLVQLKQLKVKYDELLKRNSELPSTQIIPRKELEIDPRITENLEDKLDADLQLVKRKLAFDVEKSALGMRKMVVHFVEDLDVFPISVYGIKTKTNVRVLRQRQLKPQFYEMQQLVINRIAEAELKGRAPERPPPEKPPRPVYRKREKKLEYFLLGLSPSTIDAKLTAKLYTLLTKYRQRKQRMEKRQKEWEDFKYNKPKINVNNPEDEAKYAEAVETIGDYKLKSDPNYTVPKHLRESTLKKYKQLLDTRERQYFLRNEFNNKVYAMRKRKEKLKQFLKDQLQVLKDVQREIPKNIHVKPPPIPEEYEEEYMEKNLEVVMTIPEEPPNPRTVQETTCHYVMPPDMDGLEREILSDYEIPDDLTEFVPAANKLEKAKHLVEMNVEDLLAYSEREEDSPWEEEIRMCRLNRNVFQQAAISRDLDEAIDAFDAALENLFTESVDVILKANIVDLHILSLHHELIILKEFESVEDLLATKVNQTLQHLIDMEQGIADLQRSLEEHKTTVADLQTKEKDIEDQFTTVVQNNKFFDFLRKIFRKKYKPPKVQNGDSESESESSSSSEESEEEDTGSVDSRDFGIIKLDENVCPKGCDTNIYKVTFELRAQRHEIELQLKEEAKAIEIVKKDIEIQTKKSRVVESNLKKNQEELEQYQRQKQQKLNTVMSTVVLNLHQLQHITPDFTTANINDCLLFSKSCLSKLYKRVEELQRDTLEQKNQHKINKMHMCRMKADCTVMKQKIRAFTREYVNKQREKFGQIVNIDELEEKKIMETIGIKPENCISIDEMEEALMKCLVHDLRLAGLDVRGMYKDETRLWTVRLDEKRAELIQTTKSNTDRVELLTILKREKVELARLLEQQPKRQEKIQDIISANKIYKQEIAHLDNIVRNQKKQLEQLGLEIKRLSTKGFSLKELPEKVKRMEIESPEYDEWMDYDQFMEQYGDYYAEQFEIEKQRRMKSAEPKIIAPESTSDVVHSLLLDLLEKVNLKIAEADVKDVVERLCESIMNRASVQDIVQNLVDGLQLEPAQEEQIVVQNVAELMYSIEEVREPDLSIDARAREILEEIVDDILVNAGQATEVLANLVARLADELPFNYVVKTESINYIVDRIRDVLLTGVDRKALMESVQSISSVQRDEMNCILDQILQMVFGKGMDFLYFIHNL